MNPDGIVMIVIAVITAILIVFGLITGGERGFKERYKTKVFLICPVRIATDKQLNRITSYVDSLEKKGIQVYYPATDTDQEGEEFQICTDNKSAIEYADEVHIFWDENSKGSLFDLGMAFALNKSLLIVNPEDVKLKNTKSFENMIREWEKRNG